MLNSLATLQQGLFTRPATPSNAASQGIPTPGELSWNALGSGDVLNPPVEDGVLLPVGNVKRFLLAGNATFTLKSTKTGQRFTYKCSEGKPNPAFPGDKWFVGLLVGPDNYADYRYIGIIDGSGFRVTRNSRVALNAPSVVALTYFLRFALAGQAAPGVEVWHAGKCGRCGRKLTVPESIASGFGPECIGKVGL